MLMKMIYNKQNIIDKIGKMLDKDAEEKIAVLGSIDDLGYELFDECFKRNNPTVFLSINRKSTTKSLLEKISKLENVYVYNNNDNINMENSNVIIIKTSEGFEAIISTFDFFENTINNTSSFVLLLQEQQNEKSILHDLYTMYSKQNSKYTKLTEEVIESLQEEKQLRNGKASTLTQMIDEDEVEKSFRNIAQVEDKNDYLKMLKIKNAIKKSNLDSSELIYGGEETISTINVNSGEDIEIDIEI